MCKEAEELQKRWKPSIGDIVVFANNNVGIIYRIEEKGNFIDYHIVSISRNLYGKTYVQDRSQINCLFTQEQLQEIVTTNSTSPHKDCELIEDFHLWFCEFFKRLYSRPAADDWIMNQFWLVYVMYKNYNKVWHDSKEKWVKREE